MFTISFTKEGGKEMEFVKYNSLHNHYDEDYIREIKCQGLGSSDWIVQEKVHGANFSFWLMNDRMHFAKRSAFIPASGDNSFYLGYEKVIEEESEKITEIHKILKSDKTVIYGELFGGYYNHPDVKKNKDLSVIQRGIQYSPNLHFYAFDIWSDDRYLDADESMEVFEKAGLLYAKPLFKGNLDECLDYPNNFQTKIPEIFAYPEVEDNICEGIVIRPLKESLLTKSGRLLLSRLIVKSKNERWAEKTKLEKKIREEEPLSDDAERLKDELMSLINRNRLENIISKIGQVDRSQLGKLIGLLSLDALEEFENMNPDFKDLDKDEQKKVKKTLNTYSVKIVKDYFT